MDIADILSDKSSQNYPTLIHIHGTIMQPKHTMYKDNAFYMVFRQNISLITKILGHPDLCAGPAEDGDARSVRRQPGGDGAAPRQGRLERDGGDGLVRAAGGGHRDEGQRAGAGLRVHDGVHRGGQKGND